MRIIKRNIPDYRLSWHKWFCWFPIHIESSWVWLEYIERKGIYYTDPGDYYWEFMYKLVTPRKI